MYRPLNSLNKRVRLLPDKVRSRNQDNHVNNRALFFTNVLCLKYNISIGSNIFVYPTEALSGLYVCPENEEVDRNN